MTVFQMFSHFSFYWANSTVQTIKKLKVWGAINNGESPSANCSNVLSDMHLGNLSSNTLHIGVFAFGLISFFGGGVGETKRGPDVSNWGGPSMRGLGRRRRRRSRRSVCPTDGRAFASIARVGTRHRESVFLFFELLKNFLFTRGDVHRSVRIQQSEQSRDS